LSETNEVWIRAAGGIAFAIRYYYHRMGAENITAIIKYTVAVRIFVFLALTTFVLANMFLLY
jgi:hypothetical protein